MRNLVVEEQETPDSRVAARVTFKVVVVVVIVVLVIVSPSCLPPRLSPRENFRVRKAPEGRWLFFFRLEISARLRLDRNCAARGR